MDIVYIRDLEIRTIIGIYDWEREQKQLISLGLEMGCDIKSCASTDSIENALNYKAVAKRLIEFVEQSEFFLVETLAERVSEIVLTEFINYSTVTDFAKFLGLSISYPFSKAE